MALSKDIVIRLLGDSKSAVDAQKAAADAAGVAVTAYRRAEREFDKQAKAVEAAARKQRQAMEQVGRGALIAGGAIVAGLGLAVKAAVDWESAWTGVLKTVDGTDKQLAQLEDGLRGLARTLPATHTEIAAVAEAAGQLGVATADIVDFTRTMVNLGETTNLTADEAATSIAQMMNVMQTAPEDVDRLGSTLVALGNAGASTERDIIQMSQRISGAAAVVGLTEDEVLALANAVASMGIEVESGGTSVSRVLTDMSKAAQSGGAELEVFAETAGMSAEEFSRAFREDPAEAFAAFIEGLGGVQAAGENVFAVLDDLGLSDVRVSQALLGMASSGDLLRESLDLGSRAWEENTALVEEAAKRYDTTAAKTEMARNAINDAAIEIGDVFLPVMASLAETVADVATWFAELPPSLQGAIGGLAGVAGVGTLAGGAFLLLAPRVMDTFRAFQELKTASPGVATGLSRVGKAAGIAGVIVAVASAVDALVDSMGPAPATMEQTTAGLLALGESAEKLNGTFEQGSPHVFGWRDSIDSVADAAGRITDPSFIDRLNDFGGSLGNILTFGAAGSSEGASEREKVINQLEQVGQSLALMVESGNAELAASQFESLSEEWERGGGDVDDLVELMPAYQEALKGVDNEQTAAAESARMQAENARLLAQDTNVAYGSLQGYAAALGLSEDATADLIQKSNDLGESLGEFVDPLGAYTGLLDEKRLAEEETARATADATDSATDSWEDYVRDVDVTLDEYLARLEQQVADQENWQLNMLSLAGRVSQGTLDELARMGPEGAALVADLVNASDEELDRFDEVTAARSKEATDAWGQQLTLAAPVLAEIGRKAGAGVVESLAAQLAAGTITVAEIARQYGISLAGGINPILLSLGKPVINAAASRPGGYQASYNADGSLYEQHSAEIAPAGAWRIWAEPETGGEAYIPLASSKRARSLDIWRETGRRLGVSNVAQYAFGGINDVPSPPSTSPYGPPISSAAGAVMQKEFDEVRAWLQANVGGVAGAGAVGGAWGSLWQLVKSQIPAARMNSTYRAGDPGYHGRGKAIDFGYGSGPGGAGSAGLASINRLLHDQVGRNLAELIYDGIGDDRPDLKNGRPLTYSASTRAEHRNHVHAAVFKKGGIFNPWVRDSGGPLMQGFTFNGLSRPEHVMPSTPVGRNSGGGSSVVNVSMEGATIAGTLDLGGGITARMEGVIVDALTTVTERAVYSR